MNTTLVTGEFTPSVLLSLADRSGRLERAGLTVERVPVTSSPAQFRSLLAGELDVALTSPDNVIAYRFVPDNPLGARADVRIVSAVDRGMGLALYGRPGLGGAEQLRGAVVGVDVPTSGFALALYALADSLGVGREEYEVTALGSTPKRLRALLDGECDATMLNAGNELVAEAAGCRRLAAVADVCPPYLGTVVGVAGERCLAPAHLLAGVLRDTARAVVAGELDEEATAEAAGLLGLEPGPARQYLARMKDPREGLVTEADVDRAALATLVGLRQRYLPVSQNGTDALAAALDPGAGLIADLP
ncbi:ABC transporter substrate-binding protein [Streptomyces sp. NPDC088387]|uniref:ABC transporter substrate-binding protein n=1 Tax=Streptomyces sp. NPDC088387 TaxID=3365859 RepID=UPI003814B882